MPCSIKVSMHFYNPGMPNTIMIVDRIYAAHSLERFSLFYEFASNVYVDIKLNTRQSQGPLKLD